MSGMTQEEAPRLADAPPSGSGSGRRLALVVQAAPASIRHGIGLFVLTLTGDQICAMTRFENGVLPWFGLPRSLPSQ